MDKVKVGIIRFLIGFVNTYGLTDIDASKAKLANYAHKTTEHN
jgi:hypothetical protein